jgi:transglutaminase-like putative cysteine protease
MSARSDGKLMLYPGERQARTLLFAGLSAAVLPQFWTADPWAVLAFLGVIVARFVGGWFAGVLCGAAARIAVFVIGATLIYVTHHSLLGLNAGLTLLLLLLTLKLMESRTARDFSVMATLGCFMCTSNLFLSQTLLAMFYELVVMTILLSALIRVSAGSRVSVGRCVALSARIFAGALPFAAILFIFVPRQGTAFRINLQGKDVNLSGISDTLSAGSFEQVVLSQALAFRADFPQGSIPEAHRLYWRANVLHDGNGFDWRRGRRIAPLPPPAATRNSEDVVQRIMLEPHGARWMPALDRPVSRVRNADLEGDQIVLSRSPIFLSSRYEVVSRTGGSETRIHPRWLEIESALPKSLDPRIIELATQLKRASTQDTIRQVLRYFRTGKFTYSLSPGKYDPKTGLVDFLFNRKVGYCEHYTAACATLLRAAGVPTRVVVGYQGGELNNVGNYVIVRQSDAHAWCESWVDGEGWVRVDPTLVIAPDRISAGFEAFLNSQPNAQRGFSGFAGRIGIDGVLKAIRQLWDSLDYQWSSGVVSFDETTQSAMLSIAGIATGAESALLWLIAITGVAGAIAVAWQFGIRRRPVPTDRARIAYNAVQSLVERKGVDISASEGPTDFLSRVARIFPQALPELEDFNTWYTSVRYGEATTSRNPRTMLAGIRSKLKSRRKHNVAD